MFLSSITFFCDTNMRSLDNEQIDHFIKNDYDNGVRIV